MVASPLVHESSTGNQTRILSVENIKEHLRGEIMTHIETGKIILEDAAVCWEREKENEWQ